MIEGQGLTENNINIFMNKIWFNDAEENIKNTCASFLESTKMLWLYTFHIVFIFK